MSVALPPLLAADPSWKAVCDLTERFGALAVPKVVVWHLGSADSAVLAHIAATLGLGAVDLSSGDPLVVLRDAVNVLRRRGTEYALRRALTALGLGEVSFVVEPSWTHDGSFLHDGLYQYGAAHWAVVIATIDRDDATPLTSDEAVLAMRALAGAKSKRDRVHLRVRSDAEVTLQFFYEPDDA